ncbi:interleukin-6 receptor subunit beta isoform X2 [Genypterus blacodes]|uniref:interleukin-6 receptor subunit beta isoform X2 n=1 Tax=Genypterus blacodes TaxID=154954 RepID=UPI003F75A7CA
MDTLCLIQVLLYFGFCCVATQEFLPSPSRPQCVFIAYSHVNCHWMPGDDSPPNTDYTLEAFLTDPATNCLSVTRSAFNCTGITETRCSGSMTSPDRWYLIRVVARSGTETASSEALCVYGFSAVQLRRPVLSDLREVQDEPTCLELQWHMPEDFALTKNDICSGVVIYQLQYSTENEVEAQIVEGHVSEHIQHSDCKKALKTKGFVRLRAPCSFKAFTQYTVRLRHRSSSVWSKWSDRLQSCTGTAAPRTAPQLWRTVHPTDDPQKRRVTLLWKPPHKSQTACTSLWFDVSCQREGSHNAVQPKSCLNMTGTSCQLILPSERFSCSLTMSNPAGTSPAAWVTLSAHTHTGLRVMNAISVKALSDSSLEVTWGADKHPSLTGFLVEWQMASGSDGQIPNWERLSCNSSSMIINGLQPGVRYTLTVNPEFVSESSGAISTQSYTKQGVPSSGPSVQVLEQSSSSVVLMWAPPPVGQQHGFITQYSLYCQREDDSQSEVYTVPADKLQYRLTGLSGLYKISMTAHTEAGEGRARPPLWVTVG